MSSSWVIKSRETGVVVFETFDRLKVAALDIEKYEAIPIEDYLPNLNVKDRAREFKEKTLAQIASDYNISIGEIIDPVMLAVKLVLGGESYLRAAELCGVNRTQLYRKVEAVRHSE